MTRSDMESLVNFKLKEISLISNKTKEAPATQLGVGLKSLLLQKVENYKNELSRLKQLWGFCLECSGKASPKIWSCYANFSVFIDYKRNQFLKK